MFSLYLFWFFAFGGDRGSFSSHSSIINGHSPTEEDAFPSSVVFAFLYSLFFGDYKGVPPFMVDKYIRE